MIALCIVAAVQISLWVPSPYGELALPQFKSAPFPYKSRIDGYIYEGKTYPADQNYADSTVGVFIPKQFKPGKEINFVVHFHGWNNHVAKVFTDYDLERQMNMSGLNAVLLVPQGPKGRSRFRRRQTPA